MGCLPFQIIHSNFFCNKSLLFIQQFQCIQKKLETILTSLQQLSSVSPLNIARSEQSSHTPGGSHQRLKHFQRKDKIVKDFTIPNQVVSEKTLIKNVHTCCISVKGKIENLKKVGKMRISTLIFIYTIHFAYLKVHKISQS